MNGWDFTPEENSLRDGIKKFLDREIAPQVDSLDKKYHPLPADMAKDFVKRLIPMGYVVSSIPAEHGGLGQSFMTSAILMEELKRVWAGLGSIVSITSSVSASIAQNGTDDQRRRFLPGLLSGDLIGCMAITEPNVGSDASSIETTASRSDKGWVINGTKLWITNGSIADVAIVTASEDRKKGAKGVIRLLVDRRESPFQSRDIPKLGLRASPTSELVFEDCRVPEGSLLAGGFAATMEALDRARVNAALSSVAVAQAALDVSLRYARERKQFGKTIGSFQLVREMLAEMHTDIAASRALTYRAVKAMDAGGPATLQSSMAKSYATEAAVRVTSRAVQIHGAYGLSEEFPVERYFRDARCYTIPDGTTQIQELIIGRELLGIKAFR